VQAGVDDGGDARPAVVHEEGGGGDAGDDGEEVGACWEEEGEAAVGEGQPAVELVVG